MRNISIVQAKRCDLKEILELQYLAYQSEAALFGTQDIPPLKQTLNEVISESESGTIYKVEDEGKIIGSVRVKEYNGTIYIGKLMVHPDYRKQGIGTKLLQHVEDEYPGKRYELFTSTISDSNIRLYKSLGYQEFKRKAVSEVLSFVYLEKWK